MNKKNQENIILYGENTLLTHKTLLTCNMPKSITKKDIYDEKLLYLNYDGFVSGTNNTNQTSCKSKVKSNYVVRNENNCNYESDNDSDCVSLISASSYDSFDSCIDNDELLEKEIIRARIQYKNKYVRGLN